jgi:hypothetical protein
MSAQRPSPRVATDPLLSSVSLLTYKTDRPKSDYSKGLSGLIRDFVGRKNELPPQDPKEWYDEFARLNEAGRYFFSTNRYIFRASKA